MPSLTGHVPAAYVRLLFDYLADQGIDAEALLSEAAPTQTDQRLQRYPVARWCALLERASIKLNDPLLGLHLGQTIETRHLGMLGYVLLACGTLAGALQRLERYNRLLYDVNALRLETGSDTVAMIWGTEHGRPGPLADETAITALVKFARDITGQADLAPRVIEFINPQPPDLTPYTGWFGCPVRFEQDSTRVVLPLSLLTLPLRQPDPALIAALEAQAESLLAELPDEDFIARSRQVISRLLREGEPGLDPVATELHLSPRTLHRRLEAEGWNYRQLLADTRLALAKEYLIDERLSLPEIALVLGYSEQSAFNRAFKQWTGETPRRWRSQK